MSVASTSRGRLAFCMLVSLSLARERAFLIFLYQDVEPLVMAATRLETLGVRTQNV